MKPVFRNPELYQVLEWREWLRERMPTGREGFVAEDLDLLALRYGPLIGRDSRADGEFILCEVKTNGAQMGYAQRRTWGLLDRLLRAGDPEGRHYKGFYVIGWNPPVYTINGVAVDEVGLEDFFLGDATIPPLETGRGLV